MVSRFNFVLSIFATICQAYNCITVPELNDLIESFQLQYINISTSFEFTDKQFLFNLTKTLFQGNKFMNIKENAGFRLFVMDSYHPEYSKRIESPKIIIGADITDHLSTFKNTWPTLYSQIDEPVYFYDGKNIVESYKFKKLKVTRTIGKMNQTFGIQWIEDSDIIKRRGNFQGELLIGITGPEPPFTFLKPIPESLIEAPLIENTKEVHTYIIILLFWFSR